MARSALVPSSVSDPTGLDSLERKALKDFARRYKACLDAYLKMVNAIPFTQFVVNATQYQFNLLPDELVNMIDSTNAIIDSVLMQGGRSSLWIFDSYIRPAYQRGTAQTYANLSIQSTEYNTARPQLESVLFSDPYQRRLGLVRARQFELMQGLSADLKRELAQTLTEGLGRGIGPLEISKNITERLDVSQSRADRRCRWQRSPV